MSALASHVRAQDTKPFSYCLRTTAVYECLSYGPDGSVVRARRRAVQHGTAFAYRSGEGGEGKRPETLLLTNQHAAEWPLVTGPDTRVDGVPDGCKKVSESLRLVDNESDAWERDDVTVSRVVADPHLDVAILKAPGRLATLPWQIGRSSALRERNLVEVRGFQLGAFKATSVGKVISSYDHDGYRDWDHDDFVVDALLSSGNSGSPVLAISCQTGEYELVGVYHAEYTEGPALNAVIGIDQLRDLMRTLKRKAPGKSDRVAAARDRTALTLALAAPNERFFPFGPYTASVQHRADGALLFQVLSRDFPLRVHPIAVIEDLPPPAPEAKSFGDLGRAWFGNAAGLRRWEREGLDGESQTVVARALDALRTDALAAQGLRRMSQKAPTSRERYDEVAKVEKGIKRAVAQHRELAQALADLAERLAPHGSELPLPLADVFRPPGEPLKAAAPPPPTP
jgi:serine protease Do